MTMENDQIDEAPAFATEFDSIAKDSTNFTTRVLHQVGERRYAFKPRLTFLLLCGTGLAIGGVACIGSLMETSVPGKAINAILPLSTAALIVGVVFASFAVIGVLAGLQPIVFDAGKGWFRCTWRSPEKTNPSLTSETAVRLTRVRAIQLLSKRVENSDDKTFYHCHEIVLALNVGRRIHVMAHGGLARIREDAQTLSRFLNKPLWEKLFL